MKGLLGRTFVAAVVVLTMSAWPAEASSSPVVDFHTGPGSMVITAGHWWITATGNVDNAGLSATCTLNDVTNAKVLDTSSWNFLGSSQGGSNASYFLTYLLYAVTGNTEINVACDGKNSNEAIRAVRLTLNGLGAIAGGQSQTGTNFSGTAWHTVAAAALGKGNWWLIGKTNVVNTSTSNTSSVGCRIVFEPDKDQTSQSMSYSPQPGDTGEVAVEMAAKLSSNKVAKLQCRAPNGRPTSVNYVKLAAYKIGNLTRMPVGGSTSNSGPLSALPLLITKYLNGSVAVGSSWTPVITLTVRAGSWLISAKTLLHDGTDTYAYCNIHGPGADDSPQAHTYGAPGGGLTGLYTQLWFYTPSPTTVTLGCQGAGTSVTFSRVTALKSANT